jgi:nucleoside-triphosphatase THEP1
VGLAQAAGYSCCGLLTSPGQEPHQLLVKNVSTGVTRQLTSPQGKVSQGSYRFDPEVLKWGGEVLTQSKSCDLLAIDELGPLEIERGQGWAVGIRILREGQFRLGLAVVRPELVTQTRSQLPNVPLEVLLVTEESRDHLPETILTMLEQGT